jgi:hypothetical protein
MDRNSAEVGWSNKQWDDVLGTVADEAQKASVVGKILSADLHPDPTAIAVPDLTLGVNLAAAQSPTRRLVVNHAPNTFFTSLSVTVALTSQEVADPAMRGALIQFRRAVNLIKRVEDALIFRGQPGPAMTPAGIAGLPPVFDVGYGGAQPGLYGGTPFFPRLNRTVPPGTPALPAGNALLAEIISGIGDLEAAGQNGPFACVLGQQYFTDLHTPAIPVTLPIDTLKPFLEGPVLRSSTLPPSTGIVIARGGCPQEVVVSSELNVRFIQITPEPRFIFRLSERVGLRVTDWTSILVLH